METALAAELAPEKDWWRGAVIYQIYPRSFQDSNDDGIGDLKGVIRRLPHIASLGVDAIWISPFFTSPMEDYGYDVSEYRDVDPMFGTLQDFDDLIGAAHRHGLRVMIDLVLSHTSDQHEWFQESRANKTNDKADWYVWADPQPDGSPPNNWLSIFGGPAWEWEGRRGQYYLHNFLNSQPDLNFHEPAVQNALLDVARFWLDRGVDGFRLDTINFYFHDKMLRSNPPLSPEERNATIAPSVNPYNFQNHLFDKNQPENLSFLRRLRAVMEEYPAIAAVGEVGDAQRGMEIMGEYTAGDDLMQMCYAFEFLSGPRLTARRIAEILHRFDKTAADGWACWAFSNHDVVRHASRWDLSDQQQKLLATLLIALRGSVCIYQGEELGLPEAEIAFEDLQDPYGKRFWPEFKGRDGCRTPMPWASNDANAGFSGAKPWLPAAASHRALAMNVQDGDAGSILAHYRRVIRLRAAHPALAKGEMMSLAANGDLLSFIRRGDDEEIFCAFNLGDRAQPVAMPDGAWTMIEGDEGDLAPWRAALFSRRKG